MCTMHLLLQCKGLQRTGVSGNFLVLKSNVEFMFAMIVPLTFWEESAFFFQTFSTIPGKGLFKLSRIKYK